MGDVFALKELILHLKLDVCFYPSTTLLMTTLLTGCSRALKEKTELEKQLYAAPSLATEKFN
ncbi:hypothetical protein ATI02_5652 [Pseudomonas baetica]|uniref:Uncharacterized protein n=1 Tax=Pseudomonas baetica TaxID=674054 RepID=A0ABX4Q742_9PSED|nr:hypothetical protein ATI02_5652 [Pseudomonas baetica]PTC16980.1 hypothetical protein C0J26_23840 [Pseudomonas baetica]